MHDAAVRAEISRPVMHHTARKIHLRERPRTDAYPRIGLRVFQEDVIAWLVLLDQIVFKQQSIRFGFNDGVLRIGDFRDHDRRLARKPFCRNEILRNPLVEVLGLAYINDIPLGVIIAIDSGGMWKERYFFLQRHCFNASKALKS